jgi:hypothetical protein
VNVLKVHTDDESATVRCLSVKGLTQAQTLHPLTPSIGTELLVAIHQDSCFTCVTASAFQLFMGTLHL